MLIERAAVNLGSGYGYAAGYGFGDGYVYENPAADGSVSENDERDAYVQHVLASLLLEVAPV